MSEIIIKTYANDYEKEILPRTNTLKLSFSNINIYILCEKGVITEIVLNYDMKGHYFSISIDDYDNGRCYDEINDMMIIKNSYAKIEIENITKLNIDPYNIKVVQGLDKKYYCIL